VAVLGHSLSGVNAYQYAGRHADLVTALIVEDIGAVVDSDWSFTTSLPRQAPSRDALASALGATAPYLEGSFRRSKDGRGLASRKSSVLVRYSHAVAHLRQRVPGLPWQVDGDPMAHRRGGREHHTTRLNLPSNGRSSGPLWERCRSYKIVGAHATLEAPDQSPLWSFQEQLLEATRGNDPESAARINNESLLNATARIRDQLAAESAAGNGGALHEPSVRFGAHPDVAVPAARNSAQSDPQPSAERQ
jgi:pimeloyl-ACP methyl ester carboxylesterase